MAYNGDVKRTEPARAGKVARDTPIVSGVYFLFKEGVLTYVGRSYDCYGRIASHRSKGRDFDFATVMPLAAEFLATVETALIDGFTPPQNRSRPEPAAPPAPVPAPQVIHPAPPDPYGDLPADAPYPSRLGTISQAKARKLATCLGINSDVISEAEEAGELRFVPGGRVSKKGPVLEALYDDVLAFLRVRRQAKLRGLGLLPALSLGGQ